MRRLLASALPLLVALLALAPTASATSGSPRVVGGTDATLADAPWQALVLPGHSLCGGSILDASHVLTAAHCVYDGQGGMSVINPADVTVRVGVLDRLAAGGETASVATVRVNPTYAPDLQTGDVAILTLSPPGLALSPTVAAIPPTDVGWRPIDGSTDLRLSGWGSTVARAPGDSSAGAMPARYLQVAKTIKSTSLCSTVYSPFPDDLLLCAGQPGLDACQGDSGGPLAVDVSGAWRLAGVVNGGAGCAWSGYPGYYARVSAPAIHDFIASLGAAASSRTRSSRASPRSPARPSPAALQGHQAKATTVRKTTR
jgi:trypsin